MSRLDPIDARFVAEEGPSAPSSARPAAYLHAGHLYASAEPRIVSTILGSCVAVCLFDPARRIGGISHFLLPERKDASTPPERFGDTSTRLLIERVAALGAHTKALQAKVFGGACVLAALQREDHLGKRNAEIAIEVLGRAGIPVLARDLGGNRGRKLVFQTDDGSAWLRAL